MPGQSLHLPQVLEEERHAIQTPFETARPLSALCISGGGVRSATFGLGALQSLAAHGLLEQFDYLSTVSGGGYIGSWLSAWATRAKGIGGVIPHLRGDAPPGPDQPDPIEHLREYNNYLTPKLGALSADTWTIVATVVRNIALNWLVLVPLLLFFLVTPRILLSLARLPAFFDNPDVVARSLFVTTALPLLCNLLFCFALWHIWRYLPSVGGVNHTSSDFARRVLAPLIAATLLFCAFDTLYYWNDDYRGVTQWKYVLATLGPAMLTWVMYLLCCGRTWRKRVRLFGCLSVAVVLLSVSLGLSEWVITTRFSPTMRWETYVSVVPPLLGVSFYAAFALFAGLSSRHLEDRDREWMSRASAGILLTSILWLAACVLVLITPGWIFSWSHWAHSAIAAAGAAAGWLAAKFPAPEKNGAKGIPWAKIAIAVAPPAFILALTIGLAAGTNVLVYVAEKTACSFTSYPGLCPTVKPEWYDHRAFLEASPWQILVLAALIFLIVARVMAQYININRFSLHGMYRDRLIRAYLGASNPDRYVDPHQIRDTSQAPNEFTGFAQSDNLLMDELVRRPFHVVNVCLNLVSGNRLAWQQRKAESFTITPLHCGSARLGYRPSKHYADGITLGTAMTISGAAASPSMGYHSSAATGFIMTLVNARLGAWLGNPGRFGAKTWTHAGPHSAVASLIREAFGLTNDRSQYVYLSDGGHFENLALYEMVRRRCRTIVVLDAGCDEQLTYEDLGNALRKIRIDMNVPITFSDGGMEPLRARNKRCAVARIEYPDAPAGRLVYVKPLVLGDEPPDVTSYHDANPSFPHQSTADQWFDESQTESYRMLGKFTLDSMSAGWKTGGPLDAFPKHVATDYLGIDAREAIAEAQ